jgi:hypothetical protein
VRRRTSIRFRDSFDSHREKQRRTVERHKADGSGAPQANRRAEPADEPYSATHGDPFSAKWDTVISEDGLPVFPVSKNLSSPELVDEICADVIPWLAAAMGITSAAFGQAPTASGKQ